MKSLHVVFSICLLTAAPLQFASAEPICETIDKCNELYRQVAKRVHDLRGDRSSARTITGQLFERSFERSDLGLVVWKDSSGLLWSDVKKVGDKTLVTHERAAAHCNELDARLPNKAEISRLTEALGIKASTGYTREILPFLFVGDSYWMREINAETGKADYFNQTLGLMGTFERGGWMNFICVADSK